MSRLSHLLQMRGLKLFVLSPNSDFGSSHLLQMRGLKRPCQERYQHNNQSHLLQMRGLKLCLSERFCVRSSRIFYRCVD